MLRCLSLLACLAVAMPAQAQVRNNDLKNVNEYGSPEYGHALTEKLALAGWISVFNGKDAYGWDEADVTQGRLMNALSASIFGPSQVQLDVVEPGELTLGDAKMVLTKGKHGGTLTPSKPGRIRLSGGAEIRSLILQPLKMQPLLNGKDLAGWKRIDRAKTPPERLAKWTVENGALHAVGGPSCVEYQERTFGDFILQVEARMNVRYANGGLFFRAIPGDFMNGYEAQLYNRCVDGDPGKPAVWATGAIDDRMNARRLTSRDGHWLVQTVIAHGPHIATWVNGYQTVDWTDRRAKHVNPRQGLRTDAGVLQLQAHDVGTDIEFRKVAVRALD